MIIEQACSQMSHNTHLTGKLYYKWPSPNETRQYKVIYRSGLYTYPSLDSCRVPIYSYTKQWKFGNYSN